MIKNSIGNQGVSQKASYYYRIAKKETFKYGVILHHSYGVKETAWGGAVYRDNVIIKCS